MSLRLIEDTGTELHTTELIPVFLSREERDTLQTLMVRLADVGAHDASSFVATLISRWELNYLMRDSLGLR